MARKRISIDVKIERQKDIVSKAKDKYEAELSVLEELMQKRRDMRSKELMKAIENSDRSYEEIMEFLGAKNTLESDRQGVES
ncbi:MAG: ErpK protein [Butyrivibrio sp.]|nr:ErpK protein [Butyrivibrio sp.]